MHQSPDFLYSFFLHLATAVIVNGFFSFMLALLTVNALGVQLSPVVMA